MNASIQPEGAAPPAGESRIDQGNPWLGLVSFTEETRAFFFGRDEEVAELARRVQRKLLTVLFGKSGLGKTSILRAGLVPRLRAQRYCPVYVRIDYSQGTPEPAEQIKEAIRRAASSCGEWSRVGVAESGESLWEFLHHRDDVLRDAAGATLTPLLIFDQFEELFTLAQSDEFGRARAGRFIEELADLVENRPPKALEARLDEDDAAAERFDFERSDYRVLIALREDYLAPLESLKKTMPSLAQNRLRLAPMTGAQALEAVLRPGGHLVSEEVAAAIVRFVAGGAELANAEVEPSLLSLICRELNDARLAQGRSEISLDLLAGSHETILTNFHERALADQPAAVRRIIEDELLTESGFRESMAEETLLKRFEAAGAAPGTLATLVDRRLLRIEERLDVRRVELTHDVLCGVVKASRDQRHEREAREATERVLEEQRARERAARHALRRARAVAVGCILLAAVALSAAVYGYLSAERAHRAERMAQQNRTVAEQARNHSEQLLGYLSDDFEGELESFGQIKIIAQFTQREIDYFHALPPALRSTETVRNGALALIGHAMAVGHLGHFHAGIHNTSEAIRLLEGLRRRGDPSEPTLVALGRAWMNLCYLNGGGASPRRGLEDCNRASALLKPLAERPGASVAARRAYLETLSDIAWLTELGSTPANERALQATRQAMQIASALGARELTDLTISADYAEAGAWQVTALGDLGRDAEVMRVGRELLVLVDRILLQRPWYRSVLHAKTITEEVLAEAADDELDPRETMRFGLAGQQTALTSLRLDPNSLPQRTNLGLALITVGQSLWARGRLDEGVEWNRKALDSLANAAQGIFEAQAGFWTMLVSDQQVVTGNVTGALLTAESAQRIQARTLGRVPPGSLERLSVEHPAQLVHAEADYEQDDFTAASRLAEQAIAQLRAVRPRGQSEALLQAYPLYFFSSVYGRAEYQLGHFAAAERAQRVALEQRQLLSWADLSVTSSRRARAEISTWLSMALARQGQLHEAAQVIGPVVRFEQSLLARDHGDVWVPYELARALYAQSLCDPARRSALRRSAAALLNGLPPRLQRVHDVRQWRRWIER